MKRKFLLIEDQTLVRKSLTALINTLDGYEVTDSVESVNEALNLLEGEPKFDLILCDYSLRGETAIDFLRRSSDKTQTPVIILTSFFNAQHLYQCVNSGAKGFLFKECDVDELEDAFATVLSGKNCFRVTENIYENPPESTHEVPEFTKVELETLRWMATGMSNKEIAKILDKSDQTVKSQVQMVLRKLDVSSRTAAVTKAGQLSIL